MLLRAGKAPTIEWQVVSAVAVADLSLSTPVLVALPVLGRSVREL